MDINELYINPDYVEKRYNPITGRFIKGHIPINKGKKMNDEIKEKIKHTFFKKGNKSIRKYRHGLCISSKKIEMIMKDNKIVRGFCSIGEAAFLTGIQRRNIGKVIKGEREYAGGFKWIQI